MSWRETARQDFVRDEGYQRALYMDPLGVPTFGIGHNAHVPLSDRAITVIFEDDLASAEDLLDTQLPAWRTYSDARQGALVNLAFNLGHRLLAFTRFFAALHREDFNAAADELVNSLWYHEVQPERRTRIVAAIRG